jgi:hypothetical protein
LLKPVPPRSPHQLHVDIRFNTSSFWFLDLANPLRFSTSHNRRSSSLFLARPFRFGHAMVFCTYCGQSFTRDEHLERHILTRKLHSLRSNRTLRPESWSPCFHDHWADRWQRADTNVKPFKCFTCHMSFARRYVALHISFTFSCAGISN